VRVFYVFMLAVATTLTGCSNMSVEERQAFHAELSKFPETQYREVYAYIKKRSIDDRGDGKYNPQFVLDHFFQGWKYTSPYAASKPSPLVQDAAFVSQVHADMAVMVNNARACCHASHARSEEQIVEIWKGRLAEMAGDAAQAKAAEERARRLGRESVAAREASLAQGEAIGAAMTSAMGTIASARGQQNASAIANQQALQAQQEQIARDNARNRQMQAPSVQQNAAPTPQANAQQEEIERLRRQVAALEAQQRQGTSAPAAPVPSPAAPRQPKPVAQDTTPQVESFWRSNVYHLRNRGSRRVQCQVSGQVSSSGIGTQPGLQNTQKAVVLFPGAEEAPFPGPVGNPRFFDCRVM
jgi:hypothetical protein